MPKSTTYYKLIDNFYLFWQKYVEPHGKETGFVSDNMTSDVLKAWHGVAFEEVCWQHFQQIKQALGVAGVKTSISAWNVKEQRRKKAPKLTC